MDGLTSATIRRIQAAHTNRFVYSDTRTVDSVQETHARELIHDAFRERIGTLPREIRPKFYANLLEEMGITTRPERELLSEIVKDEISSAHLAVTRAKLEGMSLSVAFPETYRSVAETLERISRSMWKESPWRGAGIGAFNMQAQFLAEKSAWMVLSPKVSAALSGYWTVLAERGILGCIVLASMGFLFAFVWAKNLIGAVIYLRTRDDADIFPFACMPMVWAAPVLVPLVCAEAFCSPVFSCSVTLFAVVAVLALSAASFPRASKPQAAAAD